MNKNSNNVVNISTNTNLEEQVKEKSAAYCRRIIGCLFLDNNVWKKAHDARIYDYFVNYADKQIFTIAMREIEENNLIDLTTYHKYINTENTGELNLDGYLSNAMDKAISAGMVGNYMHSLKEINEKLAQNNLSVNHQGAIHVPKHLQEIQGVLGEVAKIHNDTSIIQQPDFAISTALAFASACYGRYIKTPTFSRAVLLMLNTGVTGSGKEHSYTVLEQIFSTLLVDVNCEHGVASERAIYEALQQNPNTILLFDEVWKLLAQANVNGSGGQGALAAIMSLYSKTDYESIKPPRRASVDDEKIKFPALTMLGASTVEKLGYTMDAMQSVDGFTNRLVIVDVPTQKDISAIRLLNRPNLNKLIRESISLEELIGFFNQVEPEKPVQVIFDEGGEREYIESVNSFNRLKGAMSPEGQALFQRSLDNATRIASLLAVSTSLDFSNPIITSDIMRWAWQYTSYWSQHMANRFEFDVFNSKAEKARQSIRGYLHRAKNQSGRSPAEIRNKCRPFSCLSISEQNQLLHQMTNEGDLLVFSTERADKYMLA